MNTTKLTADDCRLLNAIISSPRTPAQAGDTVPNHLLEYHILRDIVAAGYDPEMDKDEIILYKNDEIIWNSRVHRSFPEGIEHHTARIIAAGKWAGAQALKEKTTVMHLLRQYRDEQEGEC